MSPEAARQFAWLLRADVRQATGALEAPNEAFEAWWLVRGRLEYPACEALTDEQRAWLLEPVGRLAVREGLALTVPRAMRLVLEARPDVRQQFGRDTLALAGWFLAKGLHEHRLMALVGPDWVRELDRPLQHPPAPAAELRPEPPAATVLMALAWQLLPAAERTGPGLDDPAVRQRFIGRFLGAMDRSPSLQALVASRWRAWLLQAIDEPAGRRPKARWQAMGLAEGAWLRGETPAGSMLARESVPAALAPATPWRGRPFGVNLFGFAYGELGIGEDVRMAVQACEAAGVPCRVVNVDPGSQLRQADRVLEAQVQAAAAQAPHGVNVFCMPGFDMVGRVVMRDGPGVLAGHYNIGWWPWELPVWPRRWAGAFDLVDEVWAATGYTEAMYAAATDKPVTRMPLPVTVERVAPLARAAFRLPERSFLFLFVFDFNSYLPRKNPGAVIEAFRQAFGPRERSVGLVLKTMNAKPEDPRWQTLQAACAKDRRIVLLEQTLDRGEVLGLVQACDAYVSLHRAEGFGRTLAEAMLLGKPVVATDFSGNTDFLTAKVGFPVRWSRLALGPGDYPFVEADDEAWWAEPDTTDAARQMQAAREAAADPAFRRRLLTQARKQFDPARIGALMRQRLETLWAAPPARPGR